MNLFEIKDAITACFDEETGEVLDQEALFSLVMQRDEIIENLACWDKNLESDVAELKQAEASFKERRKAKERKRDNIRKYLTDALGGKKFETANVAVSFRKSQRLIINDEDSFIRQHADICRKEVYEIPKKAITDMIKQGVMVDGAHIEEFQNIQIK